MLADRTWTRDGGPATAAQQHCIKRERAGARQQQSQRHRQAQEIPPPPRATRADKAGAVGHLHLRAGHHHLDGHQSSHVAYEKPENHRHAAKEFHDGDDPGEDSRYGEAEILEEPGKACGAGWEQLRVPVDDERRTHGEAQDKQRCVAPSLGSAVHNTHPQCHDGFARMVQGACNRSTTVDQEGVLRKCSGEGGKNKNTSSRPPSASYRWGRVATRAVTRNSDPADTRIAITRPRARHPGATYRPPSRPSTRVWTTSRFPLNFRNRGGKIHSCRPPRERRPRTGSGRRQR